MSGTFMPFCSNNRKVFFIMDDRDLQFIQDQIGYQFKNPDLLQQAFVRRSYAQENGGADNEVLEFIGDKVLDISVVRYLTDRYGYMASECDNYDSDKEWDEFYSELSEGKLTDLKRRLVEKKMLAHRIDILNFSDYLIMGNGDEQNNINKERSVKEDLFEAIMGAVALDSNWNFEDIQTVFNFMLDPDTELAEDGDENYVGLIQNWVTKFNPSHVPLYYSKKFSYQASWNMSFNRVSQNNIPSSEVHRMQYSCLLKIHDDEPIFRGFGASKSEARKAVCKVAYDYLKRNGKLGSIKTEIENPNKADAINQLETLARRGYFSIPSYDFSVEYDNDGNPIWTCECTIAEYTRISSAVSSSKKGAKKAAAYRMLQQILN